MVFYILVIAFVCGFSAVTLLGHILLVIAIWPGIFGKRQVAKPDLRIAAADPAPPPSLTGRRAAA